MTPVLQPPTLSRTANQVYDAMSLFNAIVLALPLSWIGGVVVAASVDVRFTGALIVDGTMIALAPWCVGIAAYMLIQRVRRNRFGVQYARPPISATDAILTMAAAMGGPVLLSWAALPEGATVEAVDLVFGLVGAFLCWVPLAQVRRCLRNA